jgi:hypothetical protein
MFLYNNGGVSIFMLIYVDNIIVVSSSQKVFDALLHDLGQILPWRIWAFYIILGIEVKKAHDGIILSQEKYANDLVGHVNMKTCKSVDTPLSMFDKL